MCLFTCVSTRLEPPHKTPRDPGKIGAPFSIVLPYMGDVSVTGSRVLRIHHPPVFRTTICSINCLAVINTRVEPFTGRVSMEWISRGKSLTKVEEKNRKNLYHVIMEQTCRDAAATLPRRTSKMATWRAETRVAPLLNIVLRRNLASVSLRP